MPVTRVDHVEAAQARLTREDVAAGICGAALKTAHRELRR